ncbi:hypothetical protein IAT40_005443 [Kwoniella sp. CBS 6097]
MRSTYIYILFGLLVATSTCTSALSLPRRPGIFPSVEERMVEQAEKIMGGMRYRKIEDVDQRYTPTRTQEESRAKRIVIPKDFEEPNASWALLCVSG